MDNIEGMMNKLPGVGAMSENIKSQLNQQLDIKQFKHMLAAIRSMTPKEKKLS